MFETWFKTYPLFWGLLFWPNVLFQHFFNRIYSAENKTTAKQRNKKLQKPPKKCKKRMHSLVFCTFWRDLIFRFFVLKCIFESKSLSVQIVDPFGLATGCKNQLRWTCHFLNYKNKNNWIKKKKNQTNIVCKSAGNFPLIFFMIKFDSVSIEIIKNLNNLILKKAVT